MTWLFADSALRLVIGLGVSVWLARYLGPESFGVLSYALAFVSLFTAIASVGIQTIVVRDILREPACREEILGTAFAVRVCGSGVAILLAVTSIAVARPNDVLVWWMVAILSLGAFFQATDVITYWFQSQVLSKYVVFSKSSAFVAISLVKVILILQGASVVAFAWAGLAEVVVGSIGLVLFYLSTGNKIRTWKYSGMIARRMVSDGWPLMVALLSYLVYMRIDQVMIGVMLDDYTVGIYSVATRIFEIPVSLIVLATSSFFPMLTELYAIDRAQFLDKYSQITRWYTFTGLVFFVGVHLFGRDILNLTFGEKYLPAVEILSIQFLGLIFMLNAGLRSSFLTITSNQKIILITTFVSAGINIVMNYYMIPVFHAKGAAFATVITQILSLLVLNVFFRETRELFVIQVRELTFFPLLRQLRQWAFR